MAGCQLCGDFESCFRRYRLYLISKGRWEAGAQDAAVVTGYITLLRAHGMTLGQIAAKAGIDRAWLGRISAGKGSSGKVRTVTASAILGVRLVPADQRDGLVDVTGTTRRLRALAVRGWGLGDIANMLDTPVCTLRRIRDGLRTGAVRCRLAMAVAAFYEVAQRKVGPSKPLTDRDFLPARVWSRESIDDPDFDPLAPARNVTGVQRRLQALAYLGQGPAQLACVLGEDAKTVAAWIAGRAVPAYAHHLVADVFERLGATPGPNVEARSHAIARGWVSPMAWIDCDIDSPTAEPILTAVGRHHGEVIEDYVNGALAGQVPQVELTTAERKVVVAALHDRGWTDLQIGLHLKWSSTDRKSRGAVMRFRRTHGIGVFRRSRDEQVHSTVAR